MTSRLTRCAATIAPLVLAATGFAQNSIVFATSVDETFFDPRGFTFLGEADDDELHIVTPVPGVRYSARALLQRQTQMALVGDNDMDGDFVDSTSNGPFLATDAAFWRRTGAGRSVTPYSIFFSATATSTAVQATTVLDGDVFRLPAPGMVEFFVREDQIVGAIGGVVGTDEIDVDAICQSANGDLFLSFDSTETVNTVSVDDGGIVMIPAASITYDMNGNVSAIAAASAVVVAQELDVDGWVTAAGLASSDGMPETTISELGGLEIDPAGGTFTSPVDPLLTVPNLLFTSTLSSSEGAIYSTSGGGSIATINGVLMGSSVLTTGRQIGLLPDSAGVSGIGALALVPAQVDPPRLVVNAFEQEYSTSDPAYSLFQAQGMTPGGPVAFVLDLPPGGSTWNGLTIPGFGGMAIIGAGVLIPVGNATADAQGFAQVSFYPAPSVIGSDIAVVINALDITSLSFAAPGVFQY